jgi:membrane protein DedA with SNARE-associated domain
MIEWVNEGLATLAASISADNVAGLAAIFGLTVSADIGVPFPFALDTILFFTTYKVGAFSWPVLLIIVMLFSGRMVGTGIIYWLSRVLGLRFVAWVSGRSRFLRRNLEQFQKKLHRWPIPVMVGARLTPGLMQVSSVAAGTMRIHYYEVVAAIVASSIVYDGTLIILGTLARLGLKNVGPEYSFWIVLGFVLIMTLLFIIVHLIRRRSALKNEQDN